MDPRIDESPTSPRMSFRDPSGQVVALDGRILRIVNPSGVADAETFLASRMAKEFLSSGRLVSTKAVEPAERDEVLDRCGLRALRATQSRVFEHQVVEFPSYPHEWSPEMLHEAGLLTLDIAEAALAEGIGLKDATPYNILFVGPKPVFVDILSFEARDPHDPTWLPYAQFIRTFILPLLANLHFGVSLREAFALERDGLGPERVYALCSPLKRLLPPFLGLVSIPVWFDNKGRRKGEDPSIYKPQKEIQPERARFILSHLLRHLRRNLGPAPRPRRSAWSGYTESRLADRFFEAKEAFVCSVLEENRPSTVLDVGCNTGHFSALAARAGARIVAIDSDAESVGRTWRRAKEQGLSILPLAVDIARPSPALGWRNREIPSFLERVGKGFDMVLMLGIMHHLLVTERVPLPESIDLIASLTRDRALVEYVGPSDPMFQRITRGRAALYGHLDRAAFESACRRRFDIECHVPSGSDRVLYLLRKMR